MLLANDKEHNVRSGLQEAISLFCKVGFKFDVELSIDGLLAVTLDQKEVFLLNIKEIIRPQNEKSIHHGMQDTFDCGIDQTETNSSGLKDEINHLSRLNGTESLSKIKRKARHKRKHFKKTDDVSVFSSSSAAESDSENSSRCHSTELKSVENKKEGAEDLSRRGGEGENEDNAELKVEHEDCSNTDQFLTSLLGDGDSFLQRVKQEPVVVVDEPDAAAVPCTSSLPSIQQRLGFMSQYIGMSQVVAGLHSGIIAPPHAYHWPEHGLTQAASTISRLATQMVVPSESVLEPTNNFAKRSKMSLNIPSIRSNGFKSSPFLSPERNICANCGTGRTTTWRRTDDKQILCNACGCYFKLHKVHRPMSMVRHEIRSRCRLPKNLSYIKYASKDRPSSDSALNLKVSPPKSSLHD